VFYVEKEEFKMAKILRERAAKTKAASRAKTTRRKKSK
jgi:hypothetical protein